MPYFGLGTYKIPDGEPVIKAVESALETGYRLIDTAAFYENEEGVGKAIRESGIKREEIFVTTKVWNTDQGYDSTLKAFEKSLKKLGLDYVDLYLVHWPVTGKYLETWRALRKLHENGVVKTIGVSNFHPQHLKRLMDEYGDIPAVNQVELHPYLNQEKLRAYCRDKGIQVQAWSPLAKGRLLNEPVLHQIGEKYGKTPAQVVLRWHLQHGIAIIPKSANPSRIQENADIFNFELTPEEMARIDGLNRNMRTGKNPDDFE
jgi:Aldo/keto reductase family.